VFAALEGMTRQAQPGAHPGGVADPDFDPIVLTGAAAASGAAAEDLALSAPVPETTGAPNA
jgi:hypothetical protein